MGRVKTIRIRDIRCFGVKESLVTVFLGVRRGVGVMLILVRMDKGVVSMCMVRRLQIFIPYLGYPTTSSVVEGSEFIVKVWLQ